MHILQKHILDSLRQASELRYSQLQPRDIESSHFKYHLNQLLKAKLVEQQSRGVYCLTNSGKAAVDQLSSGRVNPHATPKVITYTLLGDEQHYYLQRKDKEPYRNLLNMIGGKVHTSEATNGAALREVHEKTSIQLQSVRLSGVAEIRISNSEGLLSHAIAYVYCGSTSEADTLVAVAKSELGVQLDLAPDTLAIIEAIESNSSLWSLDLDLHL